MKAKLLWKGICEKNGIVMEEIIIDETIMGYNLSNLEKKINKHYILCKYFSQMKWSEKYRGKKKKKITKKKKFHKNYFKFIKLTK